MELKPQDIVVAIDLATRQPLPGTPSAIDMPISRRDVAARLGVSLGSVVASYKRLEALGLIARLAIKVERQMQANRSALLEFLQYGLRYYSHPETVGVGRGTPTGWSAPGLRDSAPMVPPETPYVWADPGGTDRGEQITPIHKSAVSLAKANKDAYAILACADIMRLGRPREIEIAKMVLSEKLAI